MKKLNWERTCGQQSSVSLRAPEKLTHEAAEPLEGAGDTNMRVDFDQDALCGVDIDLQKASLI